MVEPPVINIIPGTVHVWGHTARVFFWLILPFVWGVDRDSYFIPKKNPNFRLQKNSYFLLAYPKQSLNVFASANFISLYHMNSELCLCYCWFELIKNTIPKKIPECVLFMTQTNPGTFCRHKKILFDQNFKPQKIPRSPPPQTWLRYLSGALGFFDCHWIIPWI